MRYLILFFFVLLSHTEIAWSQSVTGTVLNDKVPLSGAIVQNLRTKSLAVTDTKGNYSLIASIGDTIVASFISLQSDTVLLKKTSFLTLILKPSTITLNEVTIVGNRISPLQRYLKNQIEYKEIYRIGNDNNIFSLGGGYGYAGFGISIDALYSALSKEGKDARRLQRILTNDYHADVVDSRFSKTLVSKVTGYHGKQLDEFMLNNRPSYEFVTQSSDYQLIQYIQRRALGISLTTDNPAPTKSSGSGFKIIYKLPKMSSYDHPSGAEFIPVSHP